MWADVTCDVERESKQSIFLRPFRKMLFVLIETSESRVGDFKIRKGITAVSKLV